MTETQSSRLERLAALSRTHLLNQEYGMAHETLAALAENLSPDAPLRSQFLQAVGTLALHLNSGSTPPPQLIDRLTSLLRSFEAPASVPLRPRQQDSSSSGARKLGPLGALLAFLAKFKTVGLLLLTKGKLLLLGLTNIKALLSILGFIGIYWAFYGWWFAVGFFASIFIHEMGHYVTVKRFGFAASAPVFIPGLGAYVRWEGANVDPVIRNRISLAGPLFGLFAALCSYLIFNATGNGIWLAVAHTGAFINLFNLIPIFMFDGGSAFLALGRQERIAVTVVSLALWFFLSEFVFLFIALGAGYRVIRKDYPPQPSQSSAYYFIGLLIVLGLFDWWMLQSATNLFPGASPMSGRGGFGNL